MEFGQEEPHVAERYAEDVKTRNPATYFKSARNTMQPVKSEVNKMVTVPTGISPVAEEKTRETPTIISPENRSGEAKRVMVKNVDFLNKVDKELHTS